MDSVIDNIVDFWLIHIYFRVVFFENYAKQPQLFEPPFRIGVVIFDDVGGQGRISSFFF
jgi:hypothetical protein